VIAKERMLMNDFFKDKRVLVTGACGTVGRELVRQLLQNYEVEELIALDNNESEIFFLEQAFQKKKQANFFLADVRDEQKIFRMVKGIDIVFHAAAFKHVILCERTPFEAVQTNILGVQNIIQAAIENKVKRVIFTSSDKAVNPTNVMGTSKLMGERLMTAANNNMRYDDTILASTRFGNVLGSRGSVIPIFREQIKKGGPVTLTDQAMTRFIMSITHAVQLVIDSSFLARGGEVFVTKMPVINIKELAEVMIHELAETYGHRTDKIKINIIGKKPGEKMYEELMSDEETRRAWELPQYYVIRSAFTGIYHDIPCDYPDIINRKVTNPYHSGNEKALSKREMTTFLRDNNLLYEDPADRKHPDERYWPNSEE
jgi:FlaA1/EpsC-like NDP-sugar epimerase